MNVSITGVGAVTCAGADLESFWKSAIEETSGLDDSGLGAIPDSVIATLRGRAPDAAGLCKPALLARVSIDAAMKEAGWSELRDDDGLIVATTVGEIPLWERELIHFLQCDPAARDAQALARAISHQSLGSIAEAIWPSSASLGGFRGRSFVVASACSAATQAIGLASLWISQGKVKRCLVGGSEVLSRLTIEGFRSLQLLSQRRAQPFDRDRSGINLSEGAAFFCLESDSDRAIAEVSGAGFSTDAYHMAAPHPEGRGSYEAMRSAISMAGIAPAEVDWVHAHGTGSKANDVSESAAIVQLFGKDRPWVSSTKWIHGHALGASGAIETALCVQALRKQTVLRTPGLVHPDPQIGVRHPGASFQAPIRHIVKNTLGFGGNNAALVLSARGVR